MEISETLRCLFTAEVIEQDDSYVIEIPDREVTLGTLTPGETYRVGVLAVASDTADVDEGATAESNDQSPPPVDEGDVWTVEIEDIGSKGDGIARVERGYVVIVPETEPGEEVTVEIQDVRETVAFAEVIEQAEPAQ